MQAGYGFDQEVTRPGTRTRSVRLEGLPDGAIVERHDRHGMVQLEDPSRDLVPYDVIETVAVPRSRLPMFLGSGLDAAALGGLIYLGFKGGSVGVSKYYAAYPAATLVADLVFAGIYSRDTAPRPLRYVPAEVQPVAYVARVGDRVYEAQLDAAWSDRVAFDEGHLVTEPGAPHIGSAPPRPPGIAPPNVSIHPSPERASRWYGWQMLPIDAGAATVIVLGVQRDQPAMIVGGAALAGLGPALVHLANGESTHALGSLGLRLGTPVVLGGVLAGFGGLLGAIIPCVGCESTKNLAKDIALVFGAGGLVTGAVLGPFADDAFLSWKETEPEASGAVQDLVPVAGIAPDGNPTFGFAGRF